MSRSAHQPVVAFDRLLRDDAPRLFVSRDDNKALVLALAEDGQRPMTGAYVAVASLAALPSLGLSWSECTYRAIRRGGASSEVMLTREMWLDRAARALGGVS